MTLLLCIATGLTLGGIVAAVTAEDHNDLTLDLLTGTSGAVLGGWLLSSVLGSAFVTSGSGFDESSALSAVGGAILLLAIVRVLHAQDSAE